MKRFFVIVLVLLVVAVALHAAAASDCASGRCPTVDSDSGDDSGSSDCASGTCPSSGGEVLIGGGTPGSSGYACYNPYQQRVVYQANACTPHCLLGTPPTQTSAYSSRDVAISPSAQGCKCGAASFTSAAAYKSGYCCGAFPNDYYSTVACSQTTPPGAPVAVGTDPATASPTRYSTVTLSFNFKQTSASGSGSSGTSGGSSSQSGASSGSSGQPSSMTAGPVTVTVGDSSADRIKLNAQVGDRTVCAPGDYGPGCVTSNRAGSKTVVGGVTIILQSYDAKKRVATFLVRTQPEGQSGQTVVPGSPGSVPAGCPLTLAAGSGNQPALNVALFPSGLGDVPKLVSFAQQLNNQLAQIKPFSDPEFAGRVNWYVYGRDVGYVNPENILSNGLLPADYVSKCAFVHAALFVAPAGQTSDHGNGPVRVEGASRMLPDSSHCDINTAVWRPTPENRGKTSMFMPAPLHELMHLSFCLSDYYDDACGSAAFDSDFGGVRPPDAFHDQQSCLAALASAKTATGMPFANGCMQRPGYQGNTCWIPNSFTLMNPGNDLTRPDPAGLYLNPIQTSRVTALMRKLLATPPVWRPTPTGTTTQPTTNTGSTGRTVTSTNSEPPVLIYGRINALLTPADKCPYCEKIVNYVRDTYGLDCINPGPDPICVFREQRRITPSDPHYTEVYGQPVPVIFENGKLDTRSDYVLVDQAIQAELARRKAAGGQPQSSVQQPSVTKPDATGSQSQTAPRNAITLELARPVKTLEAGRVYDLQIAGTPGSKVHYAIADATDPSGRSGTLFYCWKDGDKQSDSSVGCDVTIPAEGRVFRKISIIPAAMRAIDENSKLAQFNPVTSHAPVPVTIIICKNNKCNENDNKQITIVFTDSKPLAIRTNEAHLACFCAVSAQRLCPYFESAAYFSDTAYRTQVKTKYGVAYDDVPSADNAARLMDDSGCPKPQAPEASFRLPIYGAVACLPRGQGVLTDKWQGASWQYQSFNPTHSAVPIIAGVPGAPDQNVVKVDFLDASGKLSPMAGAIWPAPMKYAMRAPGPGDQFATAYPSYNCHYRTPIIFDALGRELSYGGLVGREDADGS